MGTLGTGSSAAAQARPTALLLFLPSGSDAIEHELAAVPTLSTGLMSATQGNYETTQLLLDITQGARVSYSAYSPALPPALALLPTGSSSFAQAARAAAAPAVGEIAAGAEVTDWREVLRRAAGAPQLLQPGLLAASIPGGAAYAGIAGADHVDGLVAADRAGHIAAASLGPAAGLPTRIAQLAHRYALLVADLPAGSTGAAQLRLLALRRPQPAIGRRAAGPRQARLRTALELARRPRRRTHVDLPDDQPAGADRRD